MMSSYGLLVSLWLSMHSVGGSQTGKSKHIKPLKTDMTGWKIPIFNRKCIFKWWMLQPVMIVFFWGKGGKWLKSCVLCAPAPIEPLQSRHHWWLDMIHGPSDEEEVSWRYPSVLTLIFWRSLQIPGYSWWGFASYQRFPRWKKRFFWLVQVKGVYCRARGWWWKMNKNATFKLYHALSNPTQMILIL